MSFSAASTHKCTSEPDETIIASILLPQSLIIYPPFLIDFICSVDLVISGNDCLVKTSEEGPFNFSKLDCHDIAVSVTSAGLQTLMPGIILKELNCSTA